MFITRSYIREHRSWLFVYGDNLTHCGYGGQAKVCRGEYNTLGIPTKQEPDMRPEAFFSDKNFYRVKLIIDDIIEVCDFSLYEKIVVLPGIGTGRAQLPTRAPRIYQYLVKTLNNLPSPK